MSGLISDPQTLHEGGRASARRVAPGLALLAVLCALPFGGCADRPAGNDAAAAATAATVTGAAFTPDDLDDAGRRADHSLAYKRVDGIDLPMAIYLPKDRPTIAIRRPVVLCIHGGAWGGWQGGDCTAFDGGGFAAHARYFAARGAVGVAISYRNMPRPKDKARFEQGPALSDLLADCRSAVRYLRSNAERFGIDPQRIAVIGDSAGGQLAGALGTIDRFDDPQDDRSVSAMADLMILCNPITDFTLQSWIDYVTETPRAWEGEHPLTREERAKALSPAWNVTGRSAPALLMHGERDGTVTMNHVELLQQRLQAAGVACELQRLPEASHAFILFGYRATGTEFLSYLHRVDRFLVAQGYLAGATPVFAVAPGTGECRVPGEASSWTVPDATVPGATTVTVAEDAQHGRHLVIAKGKGGLVLAGQPIRGGSTSISLWICPDVVDGTLVQRTTRSGGSTGFSLGLSKRQGLAVTVAGATLTSAAPPVKAWTHVALSITPGRVDLWCNGQQVATKEGGGITLIGSRLVIGANYAGRIADLRLFDHGLSDQEVAKLAAAAP